MVMIRLYSKTNRDGHQLTQKTESKTTTIMTTITATMDPTITPMLDDPPPPLSPLVVGDGVGDEVGSVGVSVTVGSTGLDDELVVVVVVGSGVGSSVKVTKPVNVSDAGGAIVGVCELHCPFCAFVCSCSEVIETTPCVSHVAVPEK